MNEIIRVNDDLAINIPFIPDMIQAYKFDKCSLCEEEFIKNKDFNNKGCPHCLKNVRTFCWAKGK